MVGTGQHRLGGIEETGGGYNNNIIVRIRGGDGCGIELGLEWRAGISESERVEWSGMEWGRRVIHLDRRQYTNTTVRGDVVVKT